MRENDEERKYFNPRILSQHMILLPINVDKFLVQETLPVQTFMSNLKCLVRGQKKNHQQQRLVRDPPVPQALQRETLAMALLTKNTSYHLNKLQ